MPCQTSSEILKNKFELSGEVKTITSNSDPELVIGQIKFGSAEDVSLWLREALMHMSLLTEAIRPVVGTINYSY